MIGLNAAEAKFSSIDPNWGDCGFDFFGFYDPPLPLTTAGVLATPTPPSKPTTNPAQPAPTPAPQQPPKTGGGGHHTPKVAHTEEPVPPAAPSAPAPQPATPGATLGSGNSGAGGGNDNSNGADSATGLGGIIASIVGSNQGSSTNSGGSGGQGSNSGGSDSGNAGSSGNGGNGGGDSNLGGVSSGGNGQSGPSQGGNGGSSNAGGANNNGGSAGGQVPGNAHHGSGSNGGGQTAVITGSNGRTMTASQLPANAGGSHGVGSVFTISGSGVSPTTISIGGPPATLGGVELSAAPAGIAARPTSSSRGGQAGGGEGGGGWTTVPLSPAGAGSPSATEALLTLPGSGSGPAQTITASQEAPGVFVVPASGSSPAITLSVGGSPANVGGVALSAGSGGIVIGGSTTVVPSAVGGGGGSGPAPLATEAIFTLTASADGVSQIVTASQISPGVFVIPASGSSPAVTLSVGGQASTVDGVVLSAGSNGIVVGGSTTIAPSTVALEEGAVLTLSGSDGPDTHTAVEVRNGVFVIPNTTGGKDITLSVGGSAITIDGTVISAAETGLVVGGKSTVPVNAFAVPTSETTGLGGYIVSGLGASGTGTQQFDGAGSRSRAGEINALIAAMLGVAVGGAILI